MTTRLPLIIGFARVSQATGDQGNPETQTKQLQEYGVHEVVTEVGSGARSDRQALRNLRARLQAGDTLVVTAIDRISRRAVDGLRFIRDVTDAGIHLAVLSQREFTPPPPPANSCCTSPWPSPSGSGATSGPAASRASSGPGPRGSASAAPRCSRPRPGRRWSASSLRASRSPASPRCTGSTTA